LLRGLKERSHGFIEAKFRVGPFPIFVFTFHGAIMRLVAIVLLMMSALPAHTQQQQGQSSTNAEHASPSPIPCTTPTLICQVQPGSSPQTQVASDQTKQEPPYWRELIAPQTITNVLLVCAAIWAGCIGLKTLKTMTVQTRATRDAAAAAMKNADAIIASERAWLMAEKTDKHGYSTGRYSFGNSSVPFGIVCRNDGATPAWIEEVQAAVAIQSRADKPPSIHTSGWTVFNGPLPVGVGKESEPITFQLDIPKNEDGTSESPDLHEHIVVYGIVKYRHPFTQRELASTTFAYWAVHGRDWERLYGHPEYNSNT
jgi:hypothetical protein